MFSPRYVALNRSLRSKHQVQRRLRCSVCQHHALDEAGHDALIVLVGFLCPVLDTIASSAIALNYDVVDPLQRQASFDVHDN